MIIDGESLYPGQIEKIQEHVLSQIYRNAVPDFQRFLWFCLENFEEVTLYCVRGNHGKQTGRAKWTASKSTNWDHFFYHSLRIAMGDQPRLDWNIIDKDWKAIFKIYDWGFLATHGDMIRRYYNLPLPKNGAGKTLSEHRELLLGQPEASKRELCSRRD